MAAEGAILVVLTPEKDFFNKFHSQSSGWGMGNCANSEWEFSMNSQIYISAQIWYNRGITIRSAAF